MNHLTDFKPEMQLMNWKQVWEQNGHKIKAQAWTQQERDFFEKDYIPSIYENDSKVQVGTNVTRIHKLGCNLEVFCAGCDGTQPLYKPTLFPSQRPASKKASSCSLRAATALCH